MGERGRGGNVWMCKAAHTSALPLRFAAGFLANGTPSITENADQPSMVLSETDEGKDAADGEETYSGSASVDEDGVVKNFKDATHSEAQREAKLDEAEVRPRSKALARKPMRDAVRGSVWVVGRCSVWKSSVKEGAPMRVQRRLPS